MSITGKSAEEISARAEYFREMIEMQIAAKSSQGLQLAYHAEAPRLIAEVYFAISGAYKVGFLPQDSRTDPTKIAALTCAAITVVRPLRPETGIADDGRYLYINAMLALRCACSIVAHPFHARTFDDIKRWRDQLDAMSFPSINPIIEDACNNDGKTTKEWEIKLDLVESGYLKGLINLFIVLKELKIYKDSAPLPA